MYETFFPVNDLLRRKTQTSLIIACLTLSVASTLFLLLFSSRIGVGITSASEGVLTVGLLNLFSQFIRFVGVLIFVVGAVLTSFMVFLMMTQRTKDFGLIKAAGCPNDLVFGYYMTELLVVTAASCALGVVVGLGADFASSSLSGFEAYRHPANLLFVPVVFVVFFVLAIVFGAKPLLNAARLSPVDALSPVQYYGLTAKGKGKMFLKSMLTYRIATRSLYRRKSATVRIVFFLSLVFIVLTVSVAGSVIAKGTTTSWVRKASGENVIVIAHGSMVGQYRTLQSAFVGAGENGVFNYLDLKLAISDTVIQRLSGITGIVKVDTRLILEERLHEVANFTIDPDTLATMPVGDNREGDALIIGVDPANLTGKWYTQGRFLKNGDKLSAVVGDSIAQTMFSQPLVQSVRGRNQQFAIVGVCVDPVNNGRVVYVPMKTLQNMTGVSSPNIVLAALDSTIDRAVVMNRIKEVIKDTGSDLGVFDFDKTTQMNTDFLDSTWSTVMLLPFFTLTSAALCLMAYVMLAIDEQRQEFAFLRAVGAKPKTVTTIVAIQSIIVLLSGCGFGLSLGTMTTLLILMRQPVVTSFTIMEIALWLFASV
ncbi:MAG TPA: FtsX-like permease family protein, partial [Candidatus Bathyarchaeia archaeon]|nr:FtsX-like permease family protein [Candidatus Bathyarchaeia archaeon]